MAGAGYKLFATGDVLTAAQVNTYLNEQTVMVFADSAARTTALSGVLSEGMMSYLQDTDSVEVYDGSAWTAIGGGSSPLTTKGDLYTFSTVDARLAAGNNGETLVADSSTTTGLAYREDYAAGKNKIINGDFTINQRGFTSTTTSATYGFDRFTFGAAGGTVTYSAETFTPGAAPVAGYEATNFARIVTTGQSAASDLAIFRQRIESVRTLAGQTATVSFYAKANSGTPSVSVEFQQQFGSGGSPSTAVSSTAVKVPITTSWARYSVVIAVPSISGKTIGTTANTSSLLLNLWVSAGTDFNSRTDSLGIQTNTFDFWGVQVEEGSVATAFQTATGTLAGELAACQRYYYRLTADTAFADFGAGFSTSTTVGAYSINFQTTMRTSPTALEQSGTASQYAIIHSSAGATQRLTCSAVPTFQTATTKTARVNATVSSGLTAGNGGIFGADNNTTAYLAWSAEL